MRLRSSVKSWPPCRQLGGGDVLGRGRAARSWRTDALTPRTVIADEVVRSVFGGFYFWWPKFTGKFLDEHLGKIHFWTPFFGFQMTFLVQHWLGVQGMPRRIADYTFANGWTTLNTVSTIGALLLGLSMLPFFLNVWQTHRRPQAEPLPDDWPSTARTPPP